MNETEKQANGCETTPTLVATNLDKTFRDFWGRPRVHAVRGVSLDARPGEIIGLLGPNGSGKSTTIKMILGLVRPSSGTVRLFGLPPSSAKARSRIGYLPEISHLHPFLTPRETLAYAAGLFNIPRERASAQIEKLLEKVGLSGVAADRRVGEFSKGMARRVGLARALIGDPGFIILDEPTSGLDPIGRRDVKALIRSLAAEGRTVLLSSHLLSEVQDVCTRVAVLVDGAVKASGSLRELLEKSGTNSIFEAMNFPDDKIAPAVAALEALGASRVTVGKPSRSLEDFFLELASNGARLDN